MPNAVEEKTGAVGEYKKYDEVRRDLEMLKVTDFVSYNRAIDEIAQWALGTMDEKRQKFYPQFSDDDFLRLLHDMGEEDRLLGSSAQEK